eukprot:CAMPEP_0119381884 /NCGR_PEP_ID=MMETSP1334-20130426/68029_1 /TAXON_ID=127549 /ORGANISM="Calcidiscus leptoporus, Strain RCC1130" /LENGTH=130 /DNA_ID=CAMNT_0007402155 /DNA_START=763 /DNA_END=1152 /DNA_ORIENTATION=-
MRGGLRVVKLSELVKEPKAAATMTPMAAVVSMAAAATSMAAAVTEAVAAVAEVAAMAVAMAEMLAAAADQWLVLVEAPDQEQVVVEVVEAVEEAVEAGLQVMMGQRSAPTPERSKGCSPSPKSAQASASA